MAKAPPEQPTSLLVILAGLVGNMMEWFDFAVYGNFAIIIGTLFFPSTDPRVSLIASFGAFAAGFAAGLGLALETGFFAAATESFLSLIGSLH